MVTFTEGEGIENKVEKTGLGKEILGKLGFRRQEKGRFIHSMEDFWSREQVERAIEKLICSGFIIQSGKLIYLSSQGAGELMDFIFPEQLQRLRRKLNT